MWSLLTLSTVGYHLQPQVKVYQVYSSPDNDGSDTVRAVCHVWDDDHHRSHPNAGLQLCHHLQEQAVEEQDKHKEEAVAGQGHQEDQHPPQPRLLQRDVWGILTPYKFPQQIHTVKVHHKDEVILTPSDDGQLYDSYAVRQVVIGSLKVANSDLLSESSAYEKK